MSQQVSFSTKGSLWPCASLVSSWRGHYHAPRFDRGEGDCQNDYQLTSTSDFTRVFASEQTPGIKKNHEIL